MHGSRKHHRLGEGAFQTIPPTPKLILDAVLAFQGRIQPGLGVGFDHADKMCCSSSFRELAPLTGVHKKSKRPLPELCQELHRRPPTTADYSDEATPMVGGS